LAKAGKVLGLRFPLAEASGNSLEDKPPDLDALTQTSEGFDTASDGHGSDMGATQSAILAA